MPLLLRGAWGLFQWMVLWLSNLVRDFFFSEMLGQLLNEDTYMAENMATMLFAICWTRACKNDLESAPHHNFSFWQSVCHNILGNDASLKRMLHCFHMGSISLSDTILVQKPWRRHSPCHCGIEKTSTSFAAKVGQQIYSSRLSFQSWRVTQSSVKNSRYSKLR